MKLISVIMNTFFILLYFLTDRRRRQRGRAPGPRARARRRSSTWRRPGWTRAPMRRASLFLKFAEVGLRVDTWRPPLPPPRAATRPPPRRHASQPGLNVCRPRNLYGEWESTRKVLVLLLAEIAKYYHNYYLSTLVVVGRALKQRPSAMAMRSAFMFFG